MTRGRHSNHVYVATDDGTAAREVLDDALSRSWLDRPAHEIERELTRQNLTCRLDQRQREAPNRDLGRSIDLSRTHPSDTTPDRAICARRHERLRPADLPRK